MINAKEFADKCGAKLRATGHACEMLHMDAVEEGKGYKFGVGIHYMGMRHALMVRATDKDKEEDLLAQATECLLEKINMMVADAA